MITRLVPVLLAISLSPLAKSAPVAAPASATVPAPDTATLESAVKLHLARNGQEVLIMWEVPEASIKGVDIYRNTHARTTGRARLKFARPKPASFIDITPDAETSYWYWIKVVFNDGRSVNYGPLETPPSEVWTPE